MPLFTNGRALIRANLEQFDPNVKIRVQSVAIGTLTDRQLAVINANRAVNTLPPIVADVLFFGWHVFRSRILKDGYQIDDVMDQIESAMSCHSVVLDLEHMTAMENPNGRADRYGNTVNDRLVLECSRRHPRPELFSVMPKGDEIKPKK